MSALLAGCSALRLAYDNAPTFVWWQLDGFFDVRSSQRDSARAAIDRWFAWHRATQLTPTVALLADARGLVAAPIGADGVCRFNDKIVALLEPSLNKALEEAAEVLPQLTEANIKAFEAKAAKDLADDREELLEGNEAERREAALKRAVERFERLYGRLGEPQRQVLRTGLMASPFELERWVAERQRRQRDTAATLRKLVADKPTREQRVAALKALAERSARSPDPAYRELQQRLTQFNCELGARLHNATTAAQREKARQNLLGWEADLRAVQAGPEATPAPN